MTRKTEIVLALIFTLASCAIPTEDPSGVSASAERATPNLGQAMQPPAVPAVIRHPHNLEREVHRVAVRGPGHAAPELRASGRLVASPVPVSIAQPGRCDTTQAGPQDRAGCPAPSSSTQRRVVARVEGLDPNVDAEIADAFATFGYGPGVYLARSMTPLTAGSDFYVQTKNRGAGTYTPCADVEDGEACGPDLWDEEVWGVSAWRWTGTGDAATPTETWQFNSGWTPAPDGLAQSWEPVFQPAIVGAYIYIPDAGGTVSKVARATGLPVQRIPSPLDGALGDADVHVSSELRHDRAGNLYYTVIALQPAPAPATNNPRGSWLVRVTPSTRSLDRDQVTSVPIASIAPPDPICRPTFAFGPFANPPVDFPEPWLSFPGAVAPAFSCGAVRPAVNAAPQPSADGSLVYVLTRTRQDSDHVVLNAVDTATMVSRWSTSLRDFLDDDCGILEPDTAIAAGDFGCRVGTQPGLDRRTGLRPGASALDLSASSPVVLPDGAVAIGTYTLYDNERGHLVVVGPDGSIRYAFNYGWLQTPAVLEDGASYSLLITNDHFDLAPFAETAIAADGHIRWSLTSQSSRSCTRGTDGSIACVDLGPLDGIELGQNNLDCFSRPGGSTECTPVQPGGGQFDFNAKTALVDRSGIWVPSSDGNLYQLSRDGRVLGVTFVDSSQVTNEVPISADASGRIYVVMRGSLAVVGPVARRSTDGLQDP